MRLLPYRACGEITAGRGSEWAPFVAHLITDREGDKAIVIQTTHVYRRHSSWLSPCTTLESESAHHGVHDIVWLGEICSMNLDCHLLKSRHIAEGLTLRGELAISSLTVGSSYPHSYASIARLVKSCTQNWLDIALLC